MKGFLTSKNYQEILHSLNRYGNDSLMFLLYTASNNFEDNPVFTKKLMEEFFKIVDEQNVTIKSNYKYYEPDLLSKLPSYHFELSDEDVYFRFNIKNLPDSVDGHFSSIEYAQYVYETIRVVENYILIKIQLEYLAEDKIPANEISNYGFPITNAYPDELEKKYELLCSIPDDLNCPIETKASIYFDDDYISLDKENLDNSYNRQWVKFLYKHSDYILIDFSLIEFSDTFAKQDLMDEIRYLNIIEIFDIDVDLSKNELQYNYDDFESYIMINGLYDKMIKGKLPISIVLVKSKRKEFESTQYIANLGEAIKKLRITLEKTPQLISEEKLREIFKIGQNIIEIHIFIRIEDYVPFNKYDYIQVELNNSQKILDQLSQEISKPRILGFYNNISLYRKDLQTMKSRLIDSDKKENKSKSEERKPPTNLEEIWDDSEASQELLKEIIEELKKDYYDIGNFIKVVSGENHWNKSINGSIQYLAGFTKVMTDNGLIPNEWKSPIYSEVLSNSFKISFNPEPFKKNNLNGLDQKYKDPFKKILKKLRK